MPAYDGLSIREPWAFQRPEVNLKNIIYTLNLASLDPFNMPMPLSDDFDLSPGQKRGKVSDPYLEMFL